jgi:hypothetical protein
MNAVQHNPQLFCHGYIKEGVSGVINPSPLSTNYAAVIKKKQGGIAKGRKAAGDCVAPAFSQAQS